MKSPLLSYIVGNVLGGRKVPGHYTCIFNKTQYFIMKHTETYIFNKKENFIRNTAENN